MKDRPLAPEAALDLRIHFDRLRRLEERCRVGLDRFVRGRLTSEDYIGLVNEQTHAQRIWRRKHEQYMGKRLD